MLREYTDVDLKPYNSFGVNARAQRLVEYSSGDELHDYFCSHGGLSGEMWRVLGGGNNTLFTGDYAGTLFHPRSSEICVIGSSGDRVMVEAEAGTDWDKLVEWSVGNGLWGLENLSGIPGQVGASPVQNVGAYGAEVKDTLCMVRFYSPEKGEQEELSNAECRFGYRDSIFKHEMRNRALITSVVFGLGRTPSPKLGYGALAAEVEKLGGASLSAIRNAVTTIRNGKLPDPKVMGNAGSFFKNPVVDMATVERLKAVYPDMPTYTLDDGKAKIPAGWLIERAGLKGTARGNVGVHDRQALVLVNKGGASGREIVEFAAYVVKEVMERFGIEIGPEINIL